jgi:hypothetical protein
VTAGTDGDACATTSEFARENQAESPGAAGDEDDFTAKWDEPRIAEQKLCGAGGGGQTTNDRECSLQISIHRVTSKRCVEFMAASPYN